MYTILLVIHTILVLFLIGIILIQKPDSDGLGGLGGGGGNVFSGRAMGNMITRTTAILATLFIISSLVLAVMSGGGRRESIVDRIGMEATETAPAETAPAAKDSKPAKSEKAEKPAVPKPE